jgi:peptidyl-prolyl cis-trans isomerase A (cyclophilin A)
MKPSATILSVLLCLLFFSGCYIAPYLLRTNDRALRKQAPAVYHVLLETSKGDITMEVRREWSPHGADRFYFLVRHGFYNDCRVFRINPGNWAQFGIPGDPRIAQAWRDRTIPDDPRVAANERGTVDYAFKDPNGRTTQIFINLKDNRATHDKEPFVPFAKIIKGMEVADALYNGYGEKSGGGIRAGHQDSLFAGGNDYLDRNFPKLDRIRKASIVRERSE